MRKERILKLVRIANKKMEEHKLVLTTKQSKFLWSIICNPVDLSDNALTFLTKVAEGFYDQNDEGFF